MLGKFGQTEAKPVSTPADLNVKLQKEYGFSRPLDVTSYESIVGSLLYAAIATRPDIAQAVGVVFLHQGHFVEKMLEKFGQTEAKPVSTPANLNVKLQKEDGFSRPVDVTSYQSIVGSLLHAAIATRPDIARAVGVVSRFCAKPYTKSFNSNKANPQISESNCISRIEIQMLMEISLVTQMQIGRVIWMTGFPLQETCSHWLVGQ